VRPTLLERDTRIPPLPELLAELAHIRELQAEHTTAAARLHARAG